MDPEGGDNKASGAWGIKDRVGVLVNRIGRAAGDQMAYAVMSKMRGGDGTTMTKNGLMARRRQVPRKGYLMASVQPRNE